MMKNANDMEEQNAIFTFTERTALSREEVRNRNETDLLEMINEKC